MKRIDVIASIATRVHQKHWRSRQGVATATRLAQKICEEWQRKVISKFGADKVSVEHAVDNYAKIDIVDTKERTAYELKVSPNNAHFEFYRDIFKVAVLNSREKAAVKRLVFLAPRVAAQKLIASGFTQDVIKIARRLGVEVVIKDY